MSTPRKPSGPRGPRKAPPVPKSMWDLSPAEKGGVEPPGLIARDDFLPETPEEDEPPSTFADLDGISAQAAKFGPGPLGFLLWMDSRFTAQGQPALSPWWRDQLSRYFESEKIWALFLVGRGGGKSTTLVRLAVLYVLFGGLFAERKVPPGQCWIWPFISANTTDAGRRISEAQALLRALGLDTKPKGAQYSRSIELVDVKGNAVSFLSIAATIAGVSGPSALGGTVDEEAKLRDRAANVNPSTEILASIAQMFRARVGVHAIRCSSAWREAGSHYAAILEGDTDATYVARIGEAFLAPTLDGLAAVAAWEASRGNAEAAQRIREHAATVTASSPNVPTWVANPTISALASRLQVEATPVAPEEGNTPRWRIWLRENASVPMAGGETTAGLSESELLAWAEANRALARGKGAASTFREDGLITIPGYGLDFKPTGGRGGGYRGL